MPQEKEMPSRQIAATDEAIDRLVYELSPLGMISPLSLHILWQPIAMGFDEIVYKIPDLIQVQFCCGMGI